jgi:hypothetical protein
MVDNLCPQGAWHVALTQVKGLQPGGWLWVQLNFNNYEGW